MRKKILMLALAAILSISTFAMAGCGGDGDNKNLIKIKVWGAQQDQDMLNNMADSFKAEYPEESFKFTFGVVGEADASKNVTDDISLAADVFMFSDDQLNTMHKAGALYEIKDNEVLGNFKTNAKANNIDSSIAAASVGDSLYAMPATADNTFFMYYDKRFVKEADIENLDKVLAACNKENKKFIMDLSDGWYISSFFSSAGCKVDVDVNGKQTCDYNNEKGILAAKAADKLALDPAFMTGDNAIITGNTGIGGTSTEKSAAVAITGTWNAKAIKNILGENMGVAKLPAIKIGENYVPWKSFGGCKLVGIKKTTAIPKWAMLFAEFITNEENQVIRFEQRGFGPSNKNAANNAKVLADPVISAVTAQMANSVTQRYVLAGYWTPTEGLGAELEAADHKKPFTDTELKKKLDDMVTAIIG